MFWWQLIFNVKLCTFKITLFSLMLQIFLFFVFCFFFSLLFQHFVATSVFFTLNSQHSSLRNSYYNNNMYKLCRVLLSLRLCECDMIRININIHTNLRQRDKLGSRQYVIWSICFLLQIVVIVLFYYSIFSYDRQGCFSFCQSICVMCIYICVICLCNIGIYSLWTFKTICILGSNLFMSSIVITITICHWSQTYQKYITAFP